MALLLIAPKSNAILEFDWARSVAIALYFLAILIFAFALQALRPSLRINPIPKPGAPLITHGIYNYLRHPMYLSLMIIASALLIQKLNLVSILIWLALGITLRIKAKFEDHLLLEIHDSAKNYQDRTIG